MKTRLLTVLFLTFTLTGCQKQSEESKTALPPGQKSPDTIQFEVADQKIGFFLDRLDNPKTPLKERKQILCKDYPNVYTKEYAPALLNSSPQYTQEELESDLNKVVDFYKVRNNIKC
ncbi:hypothetical protein [Acinetobacter baumannii]|uniref:hypothetical protein n=1 Tax=Acinetobacter baumannii TaxID=470 RepID=UPI0013B98F4C|nr:hypothetical protein [Acinetobacter baumannii]NDX18361.1 hypothetical protein [Acinetobacter baumannii]NDX36570.1 hypothetical protein [Acinetobacter baumannii]